MNSSQPSAVVVDGATGGAHREHADGEDRQQLPRREVAGRQPQCPPRRPQQQQRADRPIHAREHQVIQRLLAMPRRHVAQQPRQHPRRARGGVGRARCRAARCPATGGAFRGVVISGLGLCLGLRLRRRFGLGRCFGLCRCLGLGGGPGFRCAFGPGRVPWLGRSPAPRRRLGPSGRLGISARRHLVGRALAWRAFAGRSWHARILAWPLRHAVTWLAVRHAAQRSSGLSTPCPPRFRTCV